MIWSVSTSARSSTETFPSITSTGSITNIPLPGWPISVRALRRSSNPLANVDEPTLDGRRGGHLRADEVRAPALPLAPLEVAIGGRGAALSFAQDVRIHAQAHRASGRAPVEPGGSEHVVEALGL